MNFEQWLLKQNLSIKSIKHYKGAVQGALTEWANNARVISGSLLDVNNQSEFRIISEKIFQLPKFIERNTKGNNMYSVALKKYSQYLSEYTKEAVENDLDLILDNPNIDLTEKKNLVKCRLGQGTFRKSLIKFWGECSVTGFKDESFLIASHIKPWAKSDSRERLDIFNGLLLIPNLDKAFDLGFITFNNNGTIHLSSFLKDTITLNILDKMKINFQDKHLKYIEYHQKNIFNG